MWFSWADGFGLQYDALVGLVGRRCLPVFLFGLWVSGILCCSLFVILGFAAGLVVGWGW